MQKYQGKPFVLLGVNSDEDRAHVQQVYAARRLNWRSWFAGGTDGEIPRRWQIQGWPTMFLIDSTGTIRYRIDPQEVVDGSLERAIDRLLLEMELSEKKG